jgi:hypothetical protein
MNSLRKAHLISGILAGSFGGLPVPNAFMREDPIKDIDIEEEYAKIQRKESDLSANERRMVVNRYKKLYS